jgi:CRISPR-associated protein Csm2
MPNGRHEQRGRGQERHGGRHGGGGRREGPPPIDVSDVRLSPVGADLFDAVARAKAEIIAGQRQRNKPSQLRKFFDELVMWDAKVNATQDQAQQACRFRDALPFIRMLNAKAAYAEGRKLVDKNFQTLLSACLKQVEDPATLRNCKLFFEAFLGFYKAFRPSDS